jgi:transcriptional regulator with XRE-family HTH domain
MNLTHDQMEAETEFHQLAVGYCVKRQRVKLDLSQEELALRCHLSRGEVQHIEHARHALREPTRRRLCLGMGLSELELVAEVGRTEMAWAICGVPEDAEMPKSLAVKLRQLGALMEGERTPPPCPSVMTPALLYLWIRAYGSTQGR